jgi:hypothetical protein
MAIQDQQVLVELPGITLAACLEVSLVEETQLAILLATPLAF